MLTPISRVRSSAASFKSSPRLENSWSRTSRCSGWLRIIQLADSTLILQGAIPAAVLALLVQAGFAWAEKLLVPSSLRINATAS
jgi:hypothetical protein